MNTYPYQVGGSLINNAPSYVERQTDIEIYNALKKSEFCYVLNCRQMGKSSLLVRTKHHLEQEGFKCTSIDITNIGSENITASQSKQQGSNNQGRRVYDGIQRAA